MIQTYYWDHLLFTTSMSAVLRKAVKFYNSLTSLHNRQPHSRQDYYIETCLLCPQLFAAWSHTGFIFCNVVLLLGTQIAKFMGPTWGPPGSCRPQLGPMLAPWTLLSGYCLLSYLSFRITFPAMIHFYDFPTLSEATLKNVCKCFAWIPYYLKLIKNITTT